MQKKKVTFLHKITAFAVGALLFVGQAGSLISASADEVDSQTQPVEKIYYEDTLFHGFGTMVDADYDVVCDESRVLSYAGMDAPSYGNGNSSMTNSCGAISGTNVIVFNDRYFPNLIPDFTPGAINSNGVFIYWPDIGWEQTVSVLENLYTTMKIPEVGGTTSANFKNALQTFASNKGYSLSFSSFASGETTVNLNALITAVNAGKIGVVLCSEYNFISSMGYNTNTNTYYVNKQNSTTGHIMMVYGYKTIGYYIDGELIGSETFLAVSSGYQTKEQGYMQLNDFSVIDEALIVNVS